MLVGGLMTPVSNAERAWHGWNNGLGHMEGVHHTPAGGRGEQGPPRHVAPLPTDAAVSTRAVCIIWSSQAK